MVTVLRCRQPHSNNLLSLQATMSHWWCRRTARISAPLNTRCAEGSNNLLHVPSCAASWNVTLTLRNKSAGISDVAKDVDDEPGHLVIEDDSLEEGEFFDSPCHENRKSHFKDVGKQVNVHESVIHELNHLFQINHIDALRMVHSKKFLAVSDAAILKTLHYLKDINISSQQLQRIPWIMLHCSDDLQRKLRKLKEPHLFHTDSEALGFCYFTLNMIMRYQKYFMSEVKTFPHHPNRVYYLAERLEVPVELVTEKIVKTKQILTMSLNRIDHMLDILYAYGMQPEDIVPDLWVFYHQIKRVEERLQRAAQAGCKRPKPWICHATHQVFERFCERQQSQKEELTGHKDLASYLSHKLECDRYVIEVYFERNRNLERMHVSMFKKKLDLLFSVGFTPQDISSCPCVLQHSERSMVARIEELKEIGYFPFPLSLLHKSQSGYRKIVDCYKEEYCKK